MAVLIDEDNDDVRAVLQRIFVRAGFTVLTDLDMPGMNGLDLCHAIRQADDIRDVPVAILSGGIATDDPRLTETQLCGTLLKPFSADIRYRGPTAAQRRTPPTHHRNTLLPATRGSQGDRTLHLVTVRAAARLATGATFRLQRALKRPRSSQSDLIAW